MQENWVYIKGYGIRFMISNLGRVKSMPRKKVKKERILKPGKDTKGYYRVNLINDEGVKRFEPIHRLVALHFIPNSLNKKFVNHKSKDKSDNSVSNLDWCTSRENNTHMRASMKKSSKYTGVYYDKARGKFYSTIKLNGKQVFLGRYEKEIDASNAYVNALSENGLSNKYVIKAG